LLCSVFEALSSFGIDVIDGLQAWTPTNLSWMAGVRATRMKHSSGITRTLIILIGFDKKMSCIFLLQYFDQFINCMNKMT
jgi:hypothetical protein